MNEEQFARLDKAVARIVRAHNLDAAPVRTEADDLIASTIRPWNQEIWAEGEVGGLVPSDDNFRYLDIDCGSACCLAGDVVIAAGARLVLPVWKADEGDRIDVTDALLDGRVRPISGLANDLLGLHDYNNLFSSSNTATQIINIARNYAEESGFTLTSTLDDLVECDDDLCDHARDEDVR